ncbi:Phosphocholine transferase AnkX [Cardinium endosymbiont of Culicoides punctatus]|nr:Phosphocholine transferase AnkX [Cardinium endosymbiont of Culicoides punctatus]
MYNYFSLLQCGRLAYITVALLYSMCTSCSQGLTHAQWSKTENKASSSKISEGKIIKKKLRGVGKRKKKNTASNNWTSYHIAAYFGSMEEFVRLKNFKADPNAKGKHEIIPIHLAAYFNHIDVGSSLLDRGANAHQKSSNNWTSLHFAAANGSSDLLEKLLLHVIKQSIPNNEFKTIELFLLEKIKQQQTDLPILLAVNESDIDVVGIFNLFVQAPGINTYTEDYAYPTANVHTNREFNSVLDLLMIIANNNANIQKNGITMLHSAAYHGHTEWVKKLLENGNDIEAKMKDDETPLHCAVYFDHADVVRLLLDARANKNAKDMYGNTLLHFAARNGSVEVCTQFPEILCDVHTPNSHGATPLHVAAWRGDQQFCNILLNAGANINAQGAHGWTPAHYAAFGNYSELFDTLKECGADLSIRNSDGKTPNDLVITERSSE